VLLGLSTIVFKNKTTLIFSLIILFVIPILILTRERITLVFILITLIFLTVYSWNTIALNIKSYILLLCLMVSIPLIFYNFKIVQFDLRVTDTIIQLKGGAENGKLKFWSIQHQAFGQTAIEIFKKRKLFGSGIKSYRYACKEVKIDFKNNCSTHPHNIFFQILSETGLIGITLYLFFLFLVTKELFLFLFYKSKRNPSIFFLLSFFFYFNPIFPSGQFFNNWYMGIGTFPLIFYFYCKINRRFNIVG
jgi:O-antigen ligase